MLKEPILGRKSSQLLLHLINQKDQTKQTAPTFPITVRS
jgi:hypothetical protein